MVEEHFAAFRDVINPQSDLTSLFSFAFLYPDFIRKRWRGQLFRKAQRHAHRDLRWPKDCERHELAPRKTRKDQVRNVNLMKRAKLDLIDALWGTQRLKCYGNVRARSQVHPTKVASVVIGKRNNGWSQNFWKELLYDDIKKRDDVHLKLVHQNGEWNYRQIWMSRGRKGEQRWASWISLITSHDLAGFWWDSWIFLPGMLKTPGMFTRKSNIALLPMIFLVF